MNSNQRQAKHTIYEIEEKIKQLQKLSTRGGDGTGSITPHQQRQIARSATQVSKLLEQIEAVSPGLLKMIKGKLPDIKQ